MSFRLRAGEALGVIGANGAGKSTLLRLLCGISQPDEGYFAMRGRPNALLDLDAGFHPELTGRENIQVSAMISGLRRKQVLRVFDEIVAFAGLEQFVDDPLRSYSSGMRMRLGFSIALATAPAGDLLVVDEVLAVGDAEFSARCFERVDAYRRAGGSIVFVSHALSLVSEFCDRAIWLGDGHVIMEGAPGDVTRCYLEGEGTRPAALASPPVADASVGR